MFWLLPERSGVLYNKEAEAGGTGSRRGGGCALLCVAVCLWVAAPGLPLPGARLCAVGGPRRPSAWSAYPKCGCPARLCPPKPLPAGCVPRSQRRLGLVSGAGLWNHTHLPFPSGSVASKPLNSSELIGLIWKWANNGS